MLKVLQINGVSVNPEQGGKPEHYVFSKGDDPPEVHYLYVYVSRRMVKYLAEKYGFSVNDFYNPPSEIYEQESVH